MKLQSDKKREEALEAEAHENMKAAMERANRRILLYGDEILEESKGVRPLRPIIIAMEVGPLGGQLSSQIARLCRFDRFGRENSKETDVFDRRSVKRKWG